MQKKRQNFLSSYLEAPIPAVSVVAGVEPAAAALMLYRLALRSPRPVVAALPGAAEAESMAVAIRKLEEMNRDDAGLLLLPANTRGKLIFPEVESRRARVLNQVLNRQFRLLLGSVTALTAPAPEPESTREAALVLRPGMEISPLKLVEKLTALDYDDEFEVSVSGEFARRGGLMDLFSPAHDFPCRLEFFGDEIDSMRSFDPTTQRSTGEISSYEVIGRGGITAGGAASADVFDYLKPGEYTLVSVHPAVGKERLRDYAGEEVLHRLEAVTASAEQCGSFIALCDAAEGALHPEAVSPDVLSRSEELISEEDAAASGAAELKRKLLLSRIRESLDSGRKVILLAPDPESIAPLKIWCRERHFPNAEIEFAAAGFPCGMTLVRERLELIAFPELVAAGYRVRAEESASPSSAVETEPPPPSAAETGPEFQLDDLDAGDYAVHVDHGIGIFRGFKILTSGGVSREVMVMEYQEGQLLYVPLLQADRVSRYLGAVGRVRLHRLGGVRWQKDQEHARSGVRSYAAEMLRLQAIRKALPGIAFGENKVEYGSFLRAFPFQDTVDQRRASAEIRKDMLSSRPMDRLLCGDVGYGKTELAMRAAFRAAAAGYQVAVIVPTTVLAQQHYQSFLERFRAFPYTIGMLSRFVSPARQQQVLAGLATGSIDIVIGTHRLCSESVKFHNLALVIIDEEQRFGVEHKERLRRYRVEADVLAMSATPIPRTLYLAMAGARDLSTLMTPPKFRLPVKTVIAPEDDHLVAEAIRTELARGGQVYYLHNRVRTIEDCCAKLRELVPDARIAVAHGQMGELELEAVMNAFLAGKIDCLVCSTIIESGLDIPNANTIIIERADRFGLAELYQLRGRVGRWKQQAYAYFLLPRGQILHGDARKRLAAIRRCSNFGAGFQLALRDLEIRGSGNLLGSEQSGHLNAIGFDLYCQLLKQEVLELKGETPVPRIEVDLAIDFVSFAISAPAHVLAASLPGEYIGGERLRVACYRKLARLTDEAHLDDYAEELRDRFGPLPPQAKALLSVIRVKLLTSRAGYRILNVVDGRVTLRNPGGSIYRLADGRAPALDYRDSPELRMLHLIKILRKAGEKAS